MTATDGDSRTIAPRLTQANDRQTLIATTHMIYVKHLICTNFFFFEADAFDCLTTCIKRHAAWRVIIVTVHAYGVSSMYTRAHMSDRMYCGLPTDNQQMVDFCRFSVITGDRWGLVSGLIRVLTLWTASHMFVTNMTPIMPTLTRMRTTT